MSVNFRWAALHREQAEQLWEIALTVPPGRTQRTIIDVATGYERLADVIETCSPLHDPYAATLMSGKPGPPPVRG
jgi:hypothetical protein